MYKTLNKLLSVVVYMYVYLITGDCTNTCMTLCYLTSNCSSCGNIIHVGLPNANSFHINDTVLAM